MNPLVSVIVPTKNSEKFIDKCLESIKNQTYKNIEIIVVDNNSTDKTKEIALKYTNKVFNKGPERSAQMNFGASKSSGKYLYRVDSDFYVEPNVIQECVDKCEKNGFDCVAVHNTSDPTVSFWAKVRKFERDMYKGDDLIVGARFWSKKSFDAVGGFNEKMIALEDYDIHNRLLENGFSIGRIISEEIHLGEPKTLNEICSISYKYGKTLSTINKDRRMISQLNPIRKAFFLNLPKFLLHPILTISFLIMNICKLIQFNRGSAKK
jgi:glycosyltransferase involved in cell wall biosynthesis